MRQLHQNLSTSWKRNLRHFALWINLITKYRFNNCCLVFLLIFWAGRSFGRKYANTFAGVSQRAHLLTTFTACVSWKPVESRLNPIFFYRRRPRKLCLQRNREPTVTSFKGLKVVFVFLPFDSNSFHFTPMTFLIVCCIKDFQIDCKLRWFILVVHFWCFSTKDAVVYNINSDTAQKPLEQGLEFKKRTKTLNVHLDYSLINKIREFNGDVRDSLPVSIN